MTDPTMALLEYLREQEVGEGCISLQWVAGLNWGIQRRENKMPQSNEEVKVQLMRQAEELIDRLLLEKKPADEIILSDIGRAAVEAGRRFGELSPNS